MNRSWKALRPLLVLVSLVVAVAGFGPADNYPRQLGIDVQNYAFQVVLRDDTDEIEGETTVDLRFVADGVSTLELDLVNATGGKGMTVRDVMSNGAALRFTHQNNRVRITLPAASRAGARVQVTVRYHGIAADGFRIGPNKHGERSYFSKNWPDKGRHWLPMIDHPYDKATSEFIVTAPAKYQVVANGLLVEEIDLADGARRTHWKQSVPIATWLNALGVAHFTARTYGFANGVPLQTWVFAKDRDNGIVTFEQPGRQAIEFFSEFVGPYAYEKLAHVQAGPGGGGMEHASAIFYGENTVRNQPASGLVAHETAHQWFGNSVTESDWNDAWLSEGFATYFAHLFTEHYQGRDAFVAGLQRSRTSVFNTQQRVPEATVVHANLTDMGKVLSQIIYQKGGWVLHMLRGQIGTDAFRKGIQTYYARYRDANASTGDLRRVMEEVSGQDLVWFFDQWTTRNTSPIIEGVWTYDGGTKRVEIDLAQKQVGKPYRLPLEIGIKGDTAAVKIEKIVLDQPQQHFSIAVEQAPSAVTLDPNTWVLMQAKFDRK